MKITNEWLKENDACSEARKWFETKKFKTDKALFLALLKEEHFSWANWGMARILPHKQRVQYAIFSARLVLPNYEKVYPNDNRVRNCIDTTERFIRGKATKKELSAAESAVWSAARSAVWSAVRSAESAALSAESAALSAAWSAEWSAVWSAVRSAESAAWSAESAALSAAWSAESAALEKIIRYGITLIEKEVLG